MRVICVNAGKVKVKSGKIYDATGILREGSYYTVLDTVVNNVGEYGYVLAEIKSSGLKGSFNIIRFMTLSGLDERNIGVKAKLEVNVERSVANEV